jgi:hypothetical protein
MRGAVQRRELPGSFQGNWVRGNSLWLRADLGVHVVAGAVDVWHDTTGGERTANDFSQAIAINRPTLIAGGGPNGVQPAVGFVAANSELLENAASAIFDASADFTIVVTAQVNNIAAAAGAAIFSNGDVTLNGLRLAPISSVRNVAYHTVAFDTFGAATVAWEAWILRSAGGVQSAWVNGAPVAVVPGNIVGHAPTAEAALGAFINGAAFGGFMDGRIWEVIGSTVALSDAEVARVNGYISATTGLF